jgi:transposase
MLALDPQANSSKANYRSAARMDLRKNPQVITASFDGIADKDGVSRRLRFSADEVAAPSRKMRWSGSSLTSCIEGRSDCDGAVCRSGRLGEGDVGVRGGRCRHGSVEQKVETEPDDIATLLASVGGDYVRVGIEAGPLSQWLVSALIEAGVPMVCVETRHMKALLKAQQINKSDPNDARGIAQMMRVGLFKPVHVKTLAAQEQRMLLTSRKLIQRKLLDIECDLRGTLRNFGLKVGPISPTAYEARIRDLVEEFPALAAIAEPLLSVRRVMREQLAVLHKMVLDTVRHDPVCKRLMTVPGVGPLVALTYRASVDQPHRFVHSREVGAHVELTPRRHQSGEIDYNGGVSKCGDTMLRAVLYEAAQSMLCHSQKWSWLKAWAVRVAQRRGMRRATVALARRIAVILHRMWVDGTDFRWSNDTVVAPTA